MRVLLVEDDKALGMPLREHIADRGYGVDWVRTCRKATDAALAVAYELVVLDLGLPDGQGLDYLKTLRRQGSKVPVIIVTAMDQIAWRIEGLNSGADDYIVKPFDLDELTARMSSVLRRYDRNPDPVLRFGELEVDVARRIARVAGRDADLTAREWAVLERLLRHPDAIVAKGQIEDSLYEFGAEIESNAVEVYISRLRKKLGRVAITTVRGVGYRIGT